MKKQSFKGLFQPNQWRILLAQIRQRQALSKRADPILVSGLFEADWYRLENSDIAQLDIDCLRHYVQYGALEGRNPNPLFDTKWYLAQNPDVAAAGVNPLLHFIKHGVAEKRAPGPFFDTDWYLKKNPDVAASGINPLVHYLQCGAFEGRDPNPFFDGDWYNAQNPDVVQAQINPLLHYLYQGVVEGRSPSTVNDVQFIQQAATYNSQLKVSPKAALAQAFKARQDRDRPKFLKRLLVDIIEKPKKLLWADKLSKNDSPPTLKTQQQDVGLTALEDTKNKLLEAIATDTDKPRIICQSSGKYALVAAPETYTYIPPAPPPNLQDIITELAVHPRFSIVVPIYNTPPDLLTKMVDSVVQQWYSQWELVLVDDASLLAETKAALKRLSHPQIKIKYLAENNGIAGATNAAIAESTGDYIVFLDHDDELTHDCLYELVLCINQANPDFIYSDEDKINSDNTFQEPHFKPDWSPDTFMSTMYTCHVSCVKKSMVDRVGGLRTECNGCQDWDFILRVTELTTKISHIPKVLYHWRIIPGSTATDIAAKSYVLEASQRVRKDALRRRDIKGTVEPISQVPGYFRVVYDLVKQPLISIIIISQDWAALKICVGAIAAQTTYSKFEIIVVSHMPAPSNIQDSLTMRIVEQASIKFICQETLYSDPRLKNFGVQHAQGDLLLFLDDHIEVTQADWLQRLGGFAQQKHIGAVGAKLVSPQAYRVQHVGLLNLHCGPTPAFWGQSKDDSGYFMRNLLEYNWLAVSGDCLIIERQKYDLIKGFSVSFETAYSDVDLCMRLRDQNFYMVVCSSVILLTHRLTFPTHYAFDKQCSGQLQADLDRLYQSNPCYFQYDPFYSTNLHPNSANFEYSLQRSS